MLAKNFKTSLSHKCLNLLITFAFIFSRATKTADLYFRHYVCFEFHHGVNFEQNR